MKKCIIVGSVRTVAFNEKEKAPDTLYVAADGGYAQMKECGITPDLLLGDFDSLSEIAEKSAAVSGKPSDGEESGYSEPPSCVEIIRFPVEKDDTDTLIAIKTAIERGCEEITLYGCLGGERFDHSIATLQSLTYAAERGARITAVGDTDGRIYRVSALRNSEMTFPADREGIFSVMSAGSECSGVTVKNAKYCIENVTVTPSFPIGVSNAFIKGKSATVSVKNGTLWVFH